MPEHVFIRSIASVHDQTLEVDTRASARVVRSHTQAELSFRLGLKFARHAVAPCARCFQRFPCIAVIADSEQLGDVLAVTGEADALNDALRASVRADGVPDVRSAGVSWHGRFRLHDLSGLSRTLAPCREITRPISARRRTAGTHVGIATGSRAKQPTAAPRTAITRDAVACARCRRTDAAHSSVSRVPMTT